MLKARYVLIVLVLLLVDLLDIEKSSGEWKTLGPYSGIITSIVVDKKGHIYAGTEGGGIYRSIDEGKNWFSANNGINNPFIPSLAISPADAIFAGTREGIYKSTDGKSWTKLSGLPPGYQIQHITFDGNTIYAALWGNAVYRSNDEKNWEMLKEGLSSPFVNALLVDKEGTVYAVTEGGAYKISRNGGKWESLGLAENIVTSAIMDEKGRIYVSTWRDGIFRTTDGGKEWKGVTKGLSNSYVRCLVMDKRGVIYAATEEGVERFDPESEKWEKAGLDGVNMKFLTSDSNGKIYGGSYGTGLFIGEGEPLKWEKRDRGITNLQVLSILHDRKGKLYAGTTWGLFEKKQDEEWVEVKSLSGIKIQSLIMDRNGNIFAGTPVGMYTADKNKWIKMENVIRAYNITSMTIDNNGILYAGTDMDGIYVSRDGGKMWEPVNEGLSSLRISKLLSKNGDIYAGTFSGIFKKSFNSEKWEDIGGELGNRIVKTAAIDNDGNFYAGVEAGGVYFSNDGKKWQTVNEGLDNLDVLSLSVDEKGIIYAGTYGGIFLKTSPGSPWKDYSGSIVNKIVQTIKLERDGNIYIGTWGAGVYKWE